MPPGARNVIQIHQEVFVTQISRHSSCTYGVHIYAGRSRVSVSMVTRNYTVCLQRRGHVGRMPTKREISAAVLSSKSFEEGALGSITPSMQRHLELTSHARSSQETTRVSMSVQEMQLNRGTRRTVDVQFPAPTIDHSILHRATWLRCVSAPRRESPD